jgi:hypothetical protein
LYNKNKYVKTLLILGNRQGNPTKGVKLMAELLGLPGWMNLVWGASFLLLFLLALLGSETCEKWMTYVDRWLHGWRRVHAEWVVFPAVDVVKPIDVFSDEMKALIDEYGGMDSVKLSSGGYIDWCDDLAHMCYTLWAQPKSRLR